MRLAALFSFPLFFLFIQAQISFASSQWPAGTNVCQGTWTYNMYDSCENGAHGSDANAPIMGTGGGCGYEQKEESCYHGNEFSRHIDTAGKEEVRKDHWYSDEEVRRFCEGDATRQGVQDREHIAAIEVATLTRGQSCYSRDWKNKCTKWMQKVQYSCRFTVNTQVNRPSGNQCGWSNDSSRPRSCVVGYRNVNKRSSACGSYSAVSSAPHFDSTGLKAEPYNFGFSCSTGDDLPDSNESEAQNKYSVLMDKLEKNNGTAEGSIVRANLGRLLTASGNLLSEGQRQNLKKITEVIEKTEELTNGLAFQSDFDCATDSQGNPWFCARKTVTLPLGERKHLESVAPFTSFKYNFSYIFQCAGTNGISANLRSGKFQLPLSPSTDEKVNFAVFDFGLRDGSPVITIEASNTFVSRGSCSLKITDSYVETDSKLLRSSLNLLTSQLKQLATIEKSVNETQNLPAKFASLKDLKQEVANRILENVAQCHSMEADKTVVSALCPVTLDYRSMCNNFTTVESAELQTLAEGIRNDACLLADVEEGLPRTSPCLKNPEAACLDKVTAALSAIGQGISKSRGTIQRVLDALKQEKERLAGINMDRSRQLEDLLNDFNSDVVLPSRPVTNPEKIEPKPGSTLVLYDGESAPYSFAQGWDASQSEAAEANINPSSGLRHVRFKLKSQSWWAAGAYLFKSFEAIDLSIYSTLKLKLSADREAKVRVYLVTVSENAESESFEIEVKKGYHEVSLDLTQLSKQGFNLSKSEGIIFANTFDEHGELTVDVDDIVAGQ